MKLQFRSRPPMSLPLTEEVVLRDYWFKNITYISLAEESNVEH